MSSAEMTILHSCLKRPAGVGPAKRLAEDAVEVLDESEHARRQVFERCEAGALEQAASQYGEPDLDLVEPRAVAGSVDEANPVGGVLQELLARRLRLEDALLAFDAESLFDAAAFGDQLDERSRSVGVELVGHEDPFRVGIGVDGLCDVGGEIRLGSSRPNRGADDLARHDVEVRDQAQRAVSDVLELDALNEAGTDGLRFMQAFERLHARLLVDADHVGSLSRELRGVSISIADSLYFGLVLLRRFALVLRGEPVLALVRSQVRFAKKRSTCLGEMLSTMPLLMASRASSGGVQWGTGSPLSAGGSHASAMIATTCSGLNFAGAPLRGSSINTPMTSFSRSLPVAPSSSAAARDSHAPAQRCRQRRTRCRSTPSSSAWSSLVRPSADIRTMWHRSTNCCAASLVRVSASSNSLCRGVTATAIELMPMRPPHRRSPHHDLREIRGQLNRLDISAEDV